MVTLVNEKTIPLTLREQNKLVQSKNGTGKLLGYIIPLMVLRYIKHIFQISVKLVFKLKKEVNNIGKA
jgi:superfamily II DNA/RNA helicase